MIHDIKNIRSNKDYYCAWYDIGRTQIVEIHLNQPDYEIGVLNKGGIVVYVPLQSLFEEDGSEYQLERIAHKFNHNTLTSKDLIQLIELLKSEI